MSYVNASIYIPDDRWFDTKTGIQPEDKQLCVVIYRYNMQYPSILQFRQKDEFYPYRNYFLDATEYWISEDNGDEYDLADKIVTPENISKWKPLGLPVNLEEKLKLEIEKAIEETIENVSKKQNQFH